MAAFALLAGTGLASAAAATVTGTIKSTDAAAHTLTLDTGVVYVVPATIVMSKMKADEEVEVVFDVKVSKNEATKVTPAK